MAYPHRGKRTETSPDIELEMIEQLQPTQKPLSEPPQALKTVEEMEVQIAELKLENAALKRDNAALKEQHDLLTGKLLAAAEKMNATAEALSVSVPSATAMNDDLEAWTDQIGEHLARKVVGAVTPEIAKQKQELNKLDITTNSVQQKVERLGRIGGFKTVLFWISCLCNIGLAGYLVYTIFFVGG